MASSQKNKEHPVNNFPSFDLHDFKGKYDDSINDWIDIRPLPFVPGISPEIPLNSTVSVYGRRRSGKSEFTKWCLQGIKQHVPWWWTFSLTKHNSFWSTVMPDKFIIGHFDDTMLERIKERQKDALDEFVKGKIQNPHAGIIWDDYNGRDIRYNSALENYYYTGRHFGTVNFFNAQFLHLTPPAIRSNSEMVVLFNTDYKDSIDEYREDFAGKLDKKQWMWMFREYCEKVKHGFLAVVADADYKEKFYYGKADLLPIDEKAIIGCPEFWKGSEKQLEQIKDGTMKRKFDMLASLGEPTAVNMNKKPAYELR